MVCDWKLVFVDIYGFHLKVGRDRRRRKSISKLHNIGKGVLMGVGWLT